MQLKVKTSHVVPVVGLLAAVVLPVVLASQAHAASLTQTYVRFDRMQTSQATTGTICAKPATTSTDVKTWSVTFPASYTLGANATFQTANISTANLAWPSGGTAWPNATSATANVAGQTVTWTNASAQTMNSGTLYCYNWTSTSAVTVKAAATNDNAGSISTFNSSAVTIDSGSYATASVASDQFTVSATVPQTFSFALDATTDSIGSLNSATATQSTTGVHATVSTNAKNGYVVYAKDTNAGLTSTAASTTIPATTGPLVAGTPGYVLDVTISSNGSGTAPTATAPYNGGGTAGNGGPLSTAYAPISSSTGPNGSGVTYLREGAIIGALTPAANDYSDVITVVGAGLF